MHSLSSACFFCLYERVSHGDLFLDSQFLYGIFNLSINEPGHEKMCLMSYANNKGADQPVHPRSLISAYVVRCLDSIISLDSIAKISRL